MNRLHPLHTPEMVAEHLCRTGRYLGDRRTGKTTAACLAAIASAIKNPHRLHFINEHTETREECREVIRCAERLVGRLGLEHIHFEMRRAECGLPQPAVIMERRP